VYYYAYIIRTFLNSTESRAMFLRQLSFQFCAVLRSSGFYIVLLILLCFILPTPTMSVGVGRMFESVCLFVCSITQKRMIPKC